MPRDHLAVGSAAGVTHLAGSELETPAHSTGTANQQSRLFVCVHAGSSQGIPNDCDEAEGRDRLPAEGCTDV